MDFKDDPRNLIIPLDLAKIIYTDWDADLAILDQPDQVYGKALHGNGRVTFKNGNTYNGEFHNGMLHGKGKFTWASGVVYEGDFTYNNISGEGVYTWPDGSTYTGCVSNGLRHGVGKFQTADQSAIYEGTWEAGLRHGSGKILFKSGAIFEGQFFQGNKQGKGKMMYPSGNYYEGDFYFDRKEGEGVMYWLNSNEKYYGQWSQNVQNGWGVHIWIEPKGEGSKYLRNRYEGEWENGERCGVGVFYYANGAKYMGQWKNNLKAGVALFITDTGGFIFGEFKQDRLIKVYATTENESRTGILPREIAPQSPQDMQSTQEQLKQIQSRRDNKETNKDNTKDQKGSSSKRPEKLAGINNPNQTQTTLQNKTIETNPYSYMIDISDLYRGLGVDSQQVETNVQTILLRNNSDLKQWYKFFAQKFENLLNENTFSLNFEGFWKVVRDSKLLNPNFSLAALNRNFLQGSKNNYPLVYTQNELNMQVDVMIKCGQNIVLTELDDLFHIYMGLECVQQEKLNYQELQFRDVKFIKNTESVHDPSRCLLFRHFVEMIVRLAYLKYGNLNELHRAIERILSQRLKPYFERKKAKQAQSFDDTKRSGHIKIVVNEYYEELNELYQIWSIENSSPQFGYSDRTINLEQISKLVNANENEKQLLISYVDKYFDNDEGHLTQNSISAIEQSSVNQTVREEGRRKKKQQEQQQQVKVEKSNIMKYELLLFEFGDVLTSYLAKKHKDLHTNKEDEFRNRMSNHLKRLKNRKPIPHSKFIQPRLEPISIKDTQKEQLKQFRIQQEIKAKLRRQLEEERRLEERERNLMALEDNDIKSEEEDEEYESEQSDY